MPSHGAPAFQPSSTSASHILSSASRSSGPPPTDQATPLADSSSCDVTPTETLPFEHSSRLQPNMATEGNEHPAATINADPPGQFPQQLVQHGPRHFTPSLGGDPASDGALSAFMAVPHYLDATNNGTGTPVSEVVNAVIGSGGYFNNQYHTYGSDIPQPGNSPPAELYESDSQMTDAVSEFGGVPLRDDQLEHMGMARIFNQFVHDATTSDDHVAVSDATEEDSTTDLEMEYEPPMSRRHPRPSTTLQQDEDDTRKFYLDHGDSDYDIESHHSAIDDQHWQLSEVDFDDFYRAPGHTFDSQGSGFGPPPSHEDHTNVLSDAEDTNGDPAADPHFADSVIHGTTQERNFNIDQFISQWIYQSSIPSIPMLSLAPPMFPQDHLSTISWWTPPAKITRPSGYSGEFYDIQQIPWWEKLRVRRSDARQLRDQCYTSYHNLQYTRQKPATRLSEEEFYFQGKSMYTEHKATIEHFQLRNLMSVPAYNTVHFAHDSKVYSWVPGYNDLQCLIDLSMPTAESASQAPVKISTMKSALGVSIAGGFFGEYALRDRGTEGQVAEGIVTKDPNGITNHIDIIASRTNRSPIGIFASNDRHVRTLDCETNIFLANYELSHAVNCTSTSPDGRLRVIIGDSPDAWVVEADTGRPVNPLRGHRDYGFACAWSPDMMQIATSNQDKTAIIWDARMWRILEKFESDVAGYRSLRFSPVGGGPRTLLLCEPADRMVIVNAQTYQTRQVLDFFGEIGGADYSPDGSTIWLANTDEHFGGFMEYDRRQWGQPYGLQQLPNEWVKESELKDDERCILNERERESRFLWNTCDEEYEELLLC